MSFVASMMLKYTEGPKLKELFYQPMYRQQVASVKICCHNYMSRVKAQDNEKVNLIHACKSLAPNKHEIMDIVDCIHNFHHQWHQGILWVIYFPQYSKATE